MDYQPAKFQCCRLSLAGLIDKLRKHDDDVISCCWDLKISNFVKLNICYHPSTLQISQLSGSNFLEVSVRPTKDLSIDGEKNSCL